MTPGPAVHRFASAHALGANVALVDLEDSVAPKQKPEARRAARQFLSGESTSTLGVRINAPATRDGAADLLALTEYPNRPELVLVPKVETARDIEFVSSLLDETEYRPELYAIVETPRAFTNLADIFAASRLGGVFFGSADYAGLMACGIGWNAMLFARAALVNSATAAGVPAIDSPFFDLDDPAGLLRECEQAKDLGFDGKGAVHPKQLPVINKVFAPTPAELDHARAVVAAGHETGRNIVTVDGKMIGAPFFAAAAALVEQADLEEGNRRMSEFTK